ncbi:unnamed protein product [Cuscuta epithymum]|uniref:Uncharacterized protein n=1 Tax=Cuscuta epithymum TaxID=186058 RepID=A0AAV0F9M1_9ASTE|nr:unnamed protein product [Cuscuta epithymum]
MAGDVRHSLRPPPLQLPRRGGSIQNQHQLLPDELRPRRPPDSLPQPPMASDLAHRFHRPNGCVAIPLLPPRRAFSDLPPRDYRSCGADCYVRTHDISALLYQRHLEYCRISDNRSTGRCCSWRSQEDRRFVLG